MILLLFSWLTFQGIKRNMPGVERSPMLPPPMVKMRMNKMALNQVLFPVTFETPLYVENKSSPVLYFGKVRIEDF
jgi:hypothetical protein